MKRTLEITRVYPHPPERVWFALTDSAALAAWLMANDFQPRVGHRFEFHTAPAPGFDGIVHCEVLQVVENKMLSYTWNGGAIQTVITFTLEAVAEGTRLHVRQTGFDGLKAVLISLILQSGTRRCYDQRLPALLEKLRDGLWQAPEAGPLPAPGECGTAADQASLGVRALIHAANITPLKRGTRSEQTPSDDGA